MRSKFLDKIASVNNKKELIIASNNPFILTGLESLIAPDFYAVRYIQLQDINKLSLNKKLFSVAIVLTGALTASQLAEIIILYRQVEKARIPTLLFSEIYIISQFGFWGFTIRDVAQAQNITEAGLLYYYNCQCVAMRMP